MLHDAFVKLKLDCKPAARSVRVLVMASPHDPNVTAGWPSLYWKVMSLLQVQYKIFRLQLFETKT